MKHVTRMEALHRRVLRRARTVAVIGASPNPARHSHSVANYLKTAGCDVVAVNPDTGNIAVLPAYATLADIAGPVDLVVIFRRSVAVPAHIAEVAAKHIEVVWLQPGAWNRAAEAAAERHGITLVKELCVTEEHRHVSQPAGHPRKWCVHVQRRKPTYEDNRRRRKDAGYVAAGGGGHAAGGGVRSVTTEKKMAKGAPSRRTGTMKRKSS